MSNVGDMKAHNRKTCTGCGVCLEICPNTCIEMQEDDEGFFYPIVDNNKCNLCGKCTLVCRDIKRIENVKFKRRAYRCFSSELSTRFCSTSGGMFTEFAKTVLNKKGYVYGAVYDFHNKVVVHKRVDEIGKLHLLRQSKYVQSNMKLILKSLISDVSEPPPVLFCGTPCQVAAINKLIGNGVNNLFTIDFACMGIASPRAFNNWISEMEEEKNDKVCGCWFKYKDRGWKNSPLTTRIDFEDGKWRVIRGNDNYYMKAYVEDILLMRPCCSECGFKGMNKHSDITIGDFWGLKERIDDTNGVSFCIVNSKKGEILLNEVVNNCDLKEISIMEACANNRGMTDCVIRNSKAHEFLVDLERCSFNKLYERYMTECDGYKCMIENK